jgi:diacylglycerol kinase (ATP)
MVEDAKPIGVLVNPSSGRGRGKKLGDAVWQTLADAGVATVDLAGGSYEKDLANAKEAVTAHSIRALLVVGGDGMMHLGVNACGNTDVPLAIVPTGTGNDSAATLGLPIGDSIAAVKVALANLAKPRAVDILECSSTKGKWLAFGTVSAGFDALVNQKANQLRFPKGPSRYQVALILELLKFRGIRYQAVIDGKPRTIDAMLCAVANAPRFGAGMMIAPHAKVDTGVLELFIVHKISRLELLKVFPKVYTGGHVSHPAVEFVTASELSLDCGDRPIFADGEYAGNSPLTAKVVPGALLVCAPSVA